MGSEIRLTFKPTAHNHIIFFNWQHEDIIYRVNIQRLRFYRVRQLVLSDLFSLYEYAFKIIQLSCFKFLQLC